VKLSRILSGDFSSNIRQRGNSYYLAGRVRVLQGGAEEVRATVRGGGIYNVALSRKTDFIEASCSCPYADSEGELCKHIWAVLLACDAKGYLLGDGLRPGLYAELAGYDEEEHDVAIPLFKSPTAKPCKEHPPAWKSALGRLNVAKHPFQSAPRPLDWPPSRELLYIIDAEALLEGTGFIIELAVRQRKKSGEWTKLKSSSIPASHLSQLPDPADRQILAVLLGAKETYGQPYYYTSDEYSYRRYQLTSTLQELLLPQMCATGRCWLRRDPKAQECPPLAWDEGPPWIFSVAIGRDDAQSLYTVTGSLQRDGERLPLDVPVVLTESGLVIIENRMARLDHHDAFRWIVLLREKSQIRVPLGQGPEFVETVMKQAQLPPLSLPEELQFEEISTPPRPGLKIKQGKSYYGSSAKLTGELFFDYADRLVNHHDAIQGVYIPERRQFLRRHREAEHEFLNELYELGFQERHSYDEQQGVLELLPNKLPQTVRRLMANHWQVEVEGKLYRNPGHSSISVSSGLDWFELRGAVDYGGVSASLPELLAALKRGDNTVKLGDGTFGLLPEEWLKKYGLIAGLGEAKDDHVRFKQSQAGFLDALLTARPEVTFDAAFAKVRGELRRFAGIAPGREPEGFSGELRPYQRDALGWFEFLRRFGFGGCLADDMGLGKTVQVLALLEARRQLRALKNGDDVEMPSLVVLPKSLVFNWKREAARFTPQLRVLDHTGTFRSKKDLDHFGEYDLILTTYGTLRNDAVLFKDVRFDYVILDEAQAIKNASTASAKAARLLNGNHKLTLSGTPIENHLGELWSLFDFLNPGFMGSSALFSLGAGRNPDEDTREMLSQALRPFILRRTKEQVAKDLPAKLEQTIFCEMEPAQRKRYDELRDHYRGLLLGKIDQDGMAKSRFVILEALLRLRQAACHPGLLDKTLRKEAGAKLDVLIPQLREVLDEGHKALVFSQFTSFLGILKEHLKKENVDYEYLDGKTKDRQACVERFQTDPECRLFLISLKAGGLGLNLTAAEYVFLLDPWWNPAVEAQAIDRAHRIGQTQRVFAYRLVARDTVEEKVLELQNTKRDLADAIINADNSLIRNLKREDLELLMS
jgi:superfamily II DNA or RNA helicase